MTTAAPTPPTTPTATPSTAPGAESPASTEYRLDYAGVSRVVAATGIAGAEPTAGAAAGPDRVELLADLHRPPVRFEGVVRDPVRLREGLSALYAVVGSDFRYVPRDRTAYLAYLRMKKETTGLAAWQAQQVFFAWLIRNDPAAAPALDPVITVHPDRLLFEVFSKDEGSYAVLSVARSAFESVGETAFGTTNIDFSQALFEGLQRMRSRRETRLTVGRESVAMATAAAAKGDAGATAAPQVIEKRVKVPDTWLRGFLQVQTAATLPADSFTLAPTDLYNILRLLRLKADRKGKRRGLRIELVPGEPPRVVLEPWETVLTAGSGPYKGRTAKVVRLYGRRRLMLLQRFLPFVESVEVRTLGGGLPSFWVLRAGDMSLTLGLTGFTSANWSQAVGFDLLLPRKATDLQASEAVVRHLAAGTWFADAAAIGKATGLKGAALTDALQAACRAGRVMFDPAEGVYRLRPLTDAPPDLNRLEYRNARERTAHDLVARKGAVRIVAENRIIGEGLELTGQVAVAEDRRDYRPVILIGEEGMVTRAECTCTAFRRQGLKAGPCPHLIALRLAHARAEAERAAAGDARSSVAVETRTYTRRRGSAEDVVQLSLERKRLRIRRGRSGSPLRPQMLRFNSVEEARAAYFARIDELDARGYLDATAG
jgi:hypothetical protein